MTDSDLTRSAYEAGPQREKFFVSVLRNPLGLVAIIMIVVVVSTAILAPIIAPYDPSTVKIFKVNAPPGDGYLLGGDSAGRDIFSRLLFGARNTLIGALIVAIVASIVGVTMGLFAGYYGRYLDLVTSWIFDALMALPAIIILLALFQSLGSSIYLSMGVFGILLSPGFFRLTRSLVQGVKNELYIDAARVSGLSDLRIITRHILLVVRAPVVIQISVISGVAIVIQAGLEFLGLGDQRVPTWGGMLQDAFQSIYTAPLSLIWPGVAIAITVASLVLLANAIRDRMQSGGSNAGNQPPLPSISDGATTAPVASSRAGHAHLSQKPECRLSGRRPVGARSSMASRSMCTRARCSALSVKAARERPRRLSLSCGCFRPAGASFSGSIVMDGKDIASLPEEEMRGLRGKRIAYVPQEPMSNLDPVFRIGYQLVEPMVTVLGISRKEAKKRALDLLARVGLPDPERTFRAYPHEVSGGMAQRVLIAGAISCNPDLLIADEPTTALDVTVQAEVLDLMRDLQAEFQMSMILVTHNFGVVADSCDRVAVMKDGCIVETNHVRPLFAAPQHSYTRMLLDAVLEGSATRTYSPPTREEMPA